jgi:hypothetical protein
MKRMSLLIAAVLLVLSPAISAENRGRLGLGVVFGAPTGLSVKYWENQRIAYQFAIGGMFKGGLMVGADYVVHENVFRESYAPFYYGAGLFIGDAGFWGPDYGHNRFALGVRGVFGVDYFVRDYPFGIALDVGPSLMLTPVTGMGVQLSLAFRFYP